MKNRWHSTMFLTKNHVKGYLPAGYSSSKLLCYHHILTMILSRGHKCKLCLSRIVHVLNMRLWNNAYTSFINISHSFLMCECVMHVLSAKRINRQFILIDMHRTADQARVKGMVIHSLLFYITIYVNARNILWSCPEILSSS